MAERAGYVREGVHRSVHLKAGVRIDAAIWSRLPSDLRMPSVARLRTFVDIVDEAADGRRVSVTARHEAVLADGRRVVLFDQRGWTSQVGGSEPGEPVDVWAYETVQGMQQEARVVGGPDEPFDDRTQEDMAASHWDSLARLLQREGIAVDAAELTALPHDVELSDRVLARIKN